jgi:hypothetical protein
MRAFLGFIVAPVIPALVPAWFSYLNQTYHPASIFIFFCLLFYAGELVIGLPAHKLLKRFGRRGFLTYVLLGFCAAAVPFLGWSLYRSVVALHYSLGELFFVTWYPGCLGALVGLVFWLVARPDRSDRPAPAISPL